MRYIGKMEQYSTDNQPDFPMLELLVGLTCREANCRCKLHKLLSKMVETTITDETMRDYALELQRRREEELEMKGEG